jgi:hypothetical protein
MSDYRMGGVAPRPSGGLLPAQIGEPFFETVGIVSAK